MENVPDSNGTKASRVKLIRAESIGRYQWNNSGMLGINDWTHSGSISVPLNGAYLNRTSGACPSGRYGTTTTCDFSSIGLTAESRTQIGNITWNLGGHNTSGSLSSTFYIAERGTTVYSGRPATWKGYVGLIYPSDYGYAVGGSVRSTCLSKTIDSYSTDDCYTNDWLALDSIGCITHAYSSDHYVYYVRYSTHTILIGDTDAKYQFYPVVYLNTNLFKIDGTGTSDNPFIIE